jgi:very-short-patch-repair endonuclease
MRSIFRVRVPAVKLHRETRNRSRSLRAEMTRHERMLWFKLRELNRLGYHFRRQVPFQTYYLDFVEHGAKLVIELDGSQHGLTTHVRKDGRRDAVLRDEGCLVLRFWNHELDEDLNAVADTVVRHLRERFPPTRKMLRIFRPPHKGEVK